MIILQEIGKWLLLAVCVGVAIFFFGRARYDAGVTDGKLAAAAQESAAVKDETKEADKIHEKRVKMSPSDIDIDGRKRGWVRD